VYSSAGLRFLESASPLLPRCFPALLPRIEAAMPKLSKTFLDKLASDPAEGERFV
jgi:hypothetical protein